MFNHLLSSTFIFIITSNSQLINSFNVDTKFPILFEAKNKTHGFFGHSVAISNHGEDGFRYVISAPKASSIYHNIPRTGTLFSCKAIKGKRKGACHELALFESYPGTLDDRLLTPDMHLGMNFAFNPEGNSMVACGHLYSDLNHYPAGICFLTSIHGNAKDLTVFKPMDRQGGISEQLRQYFRHHKYSHEMFGFSSIFTDNSTQILFGAPGYNIFRGAILAYDLNQFHPLASNLSVINEIPQVSENSYLGYTLTSGKFFKGYNHLIAVGAPRSGELRGEIFIVQLNPGSLFADFICARTGSHIGEYFGSSLIAVDLDNNGHHDLLVGAPLHMPSSNPRGDCGRVYVYLSNGKDLREPIILNGDGKVGSRFGSSLAEIGDLNQDGFTDFAVGAPYEDNNQGSVYIYSGDIASNQRYLQKISAQQFTGLRGFGSCIAKGQDVDGNHYPDLLIGSYLSEKAVLLRSRPIASAELELKFSVNQIDHDSINCQDERRKKGFCFHVQYCLEIHGKHLPDQSRVSVFLELETLSTSPESFEKRAFFQTNGISVSWIQNVELIERSTPFCSHLVKVFLKRPVNEDEIGLKVNMTIEFVPETKSQFCSSCLILASGNSLSKSIFFNRKTRRLTHLVL